MLHVRTEPFGCSSAADFTFALADVEGGTKTSTIQESKSIFNLFSSNVNVEKKKKKKELKAQRNTAEMEHVSLMENTSSERS